MMKYPLNSSFADRITDFVDYKRSLGHSYEESCRVLWKFDLFCCDRFPEKSGFDRDIAMAWLEMREQPVWLEDWKGMRILDAVWHAPEKKAVIRLEKSDDIPMLLRIGTRTFDFTAELDGRPVAFRQDVLNGAAEFPLPAAGTLTLAF